MQDVTPNRHRHRSPLVLGITLILLGALLLALNLGLGLPLSLWQYWPFALMVPGMIAIVVPSRHLSRSGGIWLLATGIYCEIGVTGLFGLGWFSAWPIFIMAYGLEVIFDSRKDRGCGNRAAGVERPGVGISGSGPRGSGSRESGPRESGES